MLLLLLQSIVMLLFAAVYCQLLTACYSEEIGMSPAESTEPCHTDRLPAELLQLVLSQLPLKDLLIGLWVSRRWRDAARDLLGRRQRLDLRAVLQAIDCDSFDRDMYYKAIYIVGKRLGKEAQDWWRRRGKLGRRCVATGGVHGVPSSRVTTIFLSCSHSLQAASESRPRGMLHRL